ncbi:Snaclec 1 [Holothuria leucospilota]|uniref:Snaclec 1 n=1 Tax=Holothuria leucospilota TaxID=206669 RepID=A0A9Q0YDC2_HOLLE|nr:Snaclec 1 [Holothuria leucospilota]
MFQGTSTFITLVSLSTQILLTTSCPDDWTSYGNHCYRYFPDILTWKGAEQLCHSYGNSHLVSIHSEDEFSFVYNLWKQMRDDKDNYGNTKNLQ